MSGEDALIGSLRIVKLIGEGEWEEEEGFARSSNGEACILSSREGAVCVEKRVRPGKFIHADRAVYRREAGILPDETGLLGEAYGSEECCERAKLLPHRMRRGLCSA